MKLNVIERRTQTAEDLLPVSYTFKRSGDCLHHNHDLKYADDFQLNSALKSFLGEQRCIGHSSAQVANVARGRGSRPNREVAEAFKEAGGGGLERHAVDNAAVACRKRFSDIRIGSASQGEQRQMIDMVNWLQEGEFSHV